MENHIEVEETSSKRDKGFTLVELLIVIVILGILATVTVFAVRGITDKGKTSACSADKNTMETAIESWFALPATGTGARIDLGTANQPDQDATGSVGNNDLVASGLLRSPSKNYVTGASGATVAVAASGCP